MKFSFNRKQKNKMIGVRLTELEFEQLSKVASENSVSNMEAARVLIEAALQDYFNPKECFSGAAPARAPEEEEKAE